MLTPAQPVSSDVAAPSDATTKANLNTKGRTHFACTNAPSCSVVYQGINATQSTSGELLLVTICIEFNGTASRTQYTFCVMSIRNRPEIAAAAKTQHIRNTMRKHATNSGDALESGPALFLH